MEAKPSVFFRFTWIWIDEGCYMLSLHMSQKTWKVITRMSPISLQYRFCMFLKSSAVYTDTWRYIYFENLIRKSTRGSGVLKFSVWMLLVDSSPLFCCLLASVFLLVISLSLLLCLSLPTSLRVRPLRCSLQWSPLSPMKISGGSLKALSDFSPALVLSCPLPLPWRTSRPCTAGCVPAIAKGYPDEKKQRGRCR